MIEWTNQERQLARDNGDGEISKVIDGFNHCANSEQMLRYMLEMPTGWACERWRAIPISKFGDVLQTILSAENNEVGKLRPLVGELANKLDGAWKRGVCDFCTLPRCLGIEKCPATKDVFELIAKAKEVLK